jgi:hypothetical protein
MISLPTAKILLFIALSLGPKDAVHQVWISSKSDNIVWTQKAYGWNLVERDTPKHNWPDDGVDFASADLHLGAESPVKAAAITHHDWNAEPVLFLENGDRIEKRDTKIFYTSNPGAPNEKIFVIKGVEHKVTKWANP